ncbi:hypothetical protein YPPY66_2194 [Yersinia pestis PY-66]|uniref:Uncharacterized protein n=1 Tax=Yersinia pseudotuberculosis serotype O:1b (strain IP 31758) TaxID=349747 RepID=A0A0U1QZW0_YERP3|nr:hypothetical protein YpsIP31758_1653 [Yersinia pseudotuberculosis IP 31758]EIQ91113.1 hypothetical protein YPPY02_1948 [Yersinia pestis PY-02]EIR95535.1 hypothetical protein YPPY36_0555 [Yersinia pestis PY-36]EIS07430.1 hypothetical protein YPPY48_2025 [Yersinia pestis PY-48]EIS19452.1 hypothetical protein YPPY52_2030 [Yersinia pestis PY-52]EIS77795.1 hypothetical protein YPPY66_2194 [Yersinia pestis PY-66]EIS79716.1 hypothetical protein YPPY72_2096 [Yersinia pestis PY-72]EIS96935.1 hypot
MNAWMWLFAYMKEDPMWYCFVGKCIGSLTMKNILKTF